MIQRALFQIQKPWSKRASMVLVWMGCALMGCSDGRPTRVPVSGRVLIDGQPLEEGVIRFYPAEHRAATGKIESDGRFTLTTYERGDGCVPGEHPVTITGVKVLDERTVRWLAPKKYASAATSGLVVEIEGATDSAEVNLTWAGGKPFNEVIVGGGD